MSDYRSKLVIIVDDERYFTSEAASDAIYLRSERDALLYLTYWWNDNWRAPEGAETPIDEIWFDHDLGYRGSGQKVAEIFGQLVYTFESKVSPVPMVKNAFVHSQNPVGADNICKTLKEYLGEGRVLRVGLPECITLA